MRQKVVGRVVNLRKIARYAASVAMVSCAAPCLRAADISFSNFNSTTGLNLQGSAARSGSVLRLTPATTSQIGSAWFNTQQSVAGGFSTTFQFQITGLSGVTDDDGNNGGDGLAFVLQNASGTALGESGEGIGYGQIANSLAVEFDTFRNLSIGDPDGNHISVQTGGTGVNSPSIDHSLGIATNLPNMSDGNVHTAQIAYQPGTLTISLDGSQALSVPVNLATKLNLNNGAAWVGYTAAGFAATENHDLQNWSFSTVPEPSGSILMLIATGTGLLFPVTRRRYC